MSSENDRRPGGEPDGTPPVSRLERIYDEESSNLEEQWRRVHFRTMLILSLVVIAAEAIISLVLLRSGLIQTPANRYFVRYLLIPTAVYILLDGATGCVCRFSRLNGRTMNYVLSLSFAVLCLAVSLFHSYFVVVYAGGVAAIALTTIYGDQRLTGITTIVMIVFDVLLALLSPWDTAVARDELYMINVCLIVIIELSTYLICFMIVQWEEKRRKAVVMRQVEIENLRRTAARDQLTGVGNRLGLRQYIDSQETGITYVMMDIDHFKSVNDRWGHTAGDGVLENLGRILLAAEGPNAAAFRYGGDEFLLAFTGSTEKQVRAACAEVRAKFRASLSGEMRGIGVDLSFGVSPDGGGLEPSRAIRLADEELYRSKRAT